MKSQLESIPIKGDYSDIEDFVGRWADWEGAQQIQITPSGNLHLSLKGLENSEVLGPGWTENGEIRFKVQFREKEMILAMQKYGDRLLLAEAGRGPTGCHNCDFYLKKVTAMELALLRTKDLRKDLFEPVKAMGISFFDWIVEVAESLNRRNPFA